MLTCLLWPQDGVKIVSDKRNKLPKQILSDIPIGRLLWKIFLNKGTLKQTKYIDIYKPCHVDKVPLKILDVVCRVDNRPFNN